MDKALHVATITALRARGFGSTSGWAYELRCSCSDLPLGDPMPHRMDAQLRHDDHLVQVLAMEALGSSNPPLFHGTRAAFHGPGGLVLPGNDVGQDQHNLGRSDVVYLTPDLELAKAYALASKGRNKARVLEVKPLSQPLVDDSTVNGEEQVSFYVDAAVVVRVIWTENLQGHDLPDQR